MKGTAFCACLLAVCAAIAPSAVCQEPAKTNVRQEIAALIKRFIDAANKGDVTTLSELVSSKSGFVAIANGAAVKGHDALVKKASALVGSQGQYSVAVGSLDINTVKGGVVIATGPYVVNAKTGAKTVQGKGAITFVLEKQGKYWRIAHMNRSPAA